MATTGAIAPTAAASADETPWTGANFAWVNPANIYGAGVTQITHATFDAGVYSQVLKAYGFDFSAIPDGAQIDGVQVVIGGAYYATAICALSLAQLLDTSRAKGGTNQYATPVNLTTSPAAYTKGGATDKWGNALSAAWVKDPDFGVAIGVIVGASNNCDVFIDSVTMEVWYTAAADTPITPLVAGLSMGGSPPENDRGISIPAADLSMAGLVPPQGISVVVPPAIKVLYW